MPAFHDLSNKGFMMKTCCLSEQRLMPLVFALRRCADTLSEEFTVNGAGQDRPVRATDYNHREFAHIDPDGNLLLFGSRLPGS
jgi:hypothetical protein